MPLKIHYISFPGLGIDEFKINSNAIEIGNFKIAWYGLIIMVGIISAILYVWFRFRENNMSSDDLIDLALFTVVSGVVGARLYYIIFSIIEDPSSYIVTNAGGFFANFGASLGKMVSVWNGGLAIYGGIIAGGTAAVLVARYKKINMLKILDFLAPAVMLAQSIGRWGNFFNAEAHGGATNIFIKMGIRAEGSFSTYYYHPTFFYESLWNLVGFLAIWLIFVKLDKTKWLHKFNGQIFYTYLIWYGLGRSWIEGLRTDSLYLIPGVIRVSQLVAILSVIAGTALMVYSLVMLKKGKENAFVKRVDVPKVVTEQNTEKKVEENGENN
ncbi:MAG: prolipoprotein diacylglyceryl transferase [Clostridia bacterium]|nr:prolipoprotein diacylglyceryl transferase [Clostridia bacterium]